MARGVQRGLQRVARPLIRREIRSFIRRIHAVMDTLDHAPMTTIAATHGVVFNFLSDRCHERFADRDLTPARRFDTAAWLDWSLHQTPLVSFTQDYLDGHDATILLRK